MPFNICDCPSHRKTDYVNSSKVESRENEPVHLDIAVSRVCFIQRGVCEESQRFVSVKTYRLSW